MFSIKLPVVMLLTVLFMCSAWSYAGQSQLLSGDESLYPRVLQLSHSEQEDENGNIIASVVSFTGGVGHADIFVSRDQGESFELLSEIRDEDFQAGLCCGGLYELPSSINSLEAGTLLWAGSVGQQESASPMQIKVYHSTDQGLTWNYLSNCVDADKPVNEGGIWEPEFAIAATGELVCFYADETPLNHSQVLRYTKTSDGVNWSSPIDVVASNNSSDRPGMPNVVALSGGGYAMSYEVCGALSCATYLRESSDALDWSDPNYLGEPVITEDGITFWATPTMTISSSANGNDQLVLQGRTLVREGVVQPDNGATVFISHSGDPAGPWLAYDSPVHTELPAGTDVDFCQNYSSPLLVLKGGKKLLQLASDFSEDGRCLTWFNAEPLGGVRASIDGVELSSGSTKSTDVRLHVSNDYGGDYLLTADVPEFKGTVQLSDSQVTVLPGRDVVVSMKVVDQKVVSASILDEPMAVAGVLCAPWFLLWAVRARKSAILVVTMVLALLAVSGCGGGASGASENSPTMSVSKTYEGTFTAVSVEAPRVKTATNFTITVTTDQ
ncbi:hypothetical protein [Gilvimarinus japonicus]|jgi:hypothetical protein|uniref:Exo-alpha-sialidase n=1 Tax=Gilvimarinus japonicus TaxID=1796469 RepID=A0ABV7HIK5_9GAMM